MYVIPWAIEYRVQLDNYVAIDEEPVAANPSGPSSYARAPLVKRHNIPRFVLCGREDNQEHNVKTVPARPLVPVTPETKFWILSWPENSTKELILMEF